MSQMSSQQRKLIPGMVDAQTPTERESIQLATDPAYRRLRAKNPLPTAEEVVEIEVYAHIPKELYVDTKIDKYRSKR